MDRAKHHDAHERRVVRDLSQPLKTRVSVSDLIDTAGNQRWTTLRSRWYLGAWAGGSLLRGSTIGILTFRCLAVVLCNTWYVMLPGPSLTSLNLMGMVSAALASPTKFRWKLVLVEHRISFSLGYLWKPPWIFLLRGDLSNSVLRVSSVRNVVRHLIELSGLVVG